MIHKYPICPDRIRTVPPKFSWIDHRLIHDRHLEHLTPEAATLYLFLVTVADNQGLSYYASRSIAQRLAMDEATLVAARHCLQTVELIAFKAPIYQVLEIQALPSRKLTPAIGVAETSAPISLKAIFQQIAGGMP